MQYKIHIYYSKFILMYYIELTNIKIDNLFNINFNSDPNRQHI